MGQEAEGADRRALGATAPVGPAAPSGALKVIQNRTRRLALCAPASATQPAETGFSLQTCGLELSPSLQPSAVPCWGKGTSAGNCRLSTLWAGIFPWVVGGGDIRVVQGQIYCRSLFSWLCAARLLLGGHSLRPLAPPRGAVMRQDASLSGFLPPQVLKLPLSFCTCSAPFPRDLPPASPESRPAVRALFTAGVAGPDTSGASADVQVLGAGPNGARWSPKTCVWNRSPRGSFEPGSVEAVTWPFFS